MGGAQAMLLALARQAEAAGMRMTVVSLTETGPVGRSLADCGIPVRALGMNRALPSPLAVLRLACLLRRERPDLVQTWLYHADLIGGLAARLAGRRVVWNIRHSDLRRGSNKRSTIFSARACAMLSRRLPARIVCNSEAAAALHVGLGYDAAKLVIIPNGVDLERFRPCPDARRAVRDELGLPADCILVGLIARFDPQKDHESFVRAAGILAADLPDAHFLLCGEHVEPANAALTGWIAKAGIAGRAHLLGRRADVPRLTASLDIATSSSAFGEAFSNVVVEAMACGIPCVVTDVGDSRQIVGETGIVVPPASPEALAEAWHELLRLPPAMRSERGAAARRRVAERFALSTMVTRYRRLYDEVTARPVAGRSTNQHPIH